MEYVLLSKASICLLLGGNIGQYDGLRVNLNTDIEQAPMFYPLQMKDDLYIFLRIFYILNEILKLYFKLKSTNQCRTRL